MELWQELRDVVAKIVHQTSGMDIPQHAINQFRDAANALSDHIKQAKFGEVSKMVSKLLLEGDVEGAFALVNDLREGNDTPPDPVEPPPVPVVAPPKLLKTKDVFLRIAKINMEKPGTYKGCGEYTITRYLRVMYAQFIPGTVKYGKAKGHVGVMDGSEAYTMLMQGLKLTGTDRRKLLGYPIQASTTKPRNSKYATHITGRTMPHAEMINRWLGKIEYISDEELEDYTWINELDPGVVFPGGDGRWTHQNLRHFYPYLPEATRGVMGKILEGALHRYFVYTPFIDEWVQDVIDTIQKVRERRSVICVDERYEFVQDK